MVRRVVIRNNDDGHAVHVLVCVTRDEPDCVHRPTRVHMRRDPNDATECDVGLDHLKEGQRVFPMFHVSGASMDPTSDILVPHLSVSDVVVCCYGEDDVQGVCMPT